MLLILPWPARWLPLYQKPSCAPWEARFISIKIPGREPELIDGADAMPHIPAQDRKQREVAWKRAHIPYGDGITVNVGHASIAVPGMLRACMWRTLAVSSPHSVNQVSI